MALRIGGTTFDCNNAGVLADFWAAAIGYVKGRGDENFAVLLPPEGTPGQQILFFKVPESKASKNRFHMDLHTAESREAEIERLVALGAQAHETHHEYGISWTVMTDPEGNEFCVAQD